MADLAICKLDLCSGQESSTGSKDGASDNASQLLLINEARERDQKNKEDLKRIRRLIAKENKKQIKINLKLQNVQSMNDSMRLGNKEFENNVKRILDGMGAKIAEGKLKPDDQFVNKVKEATENFGAKLEGQKGDVGKKREDCDRLKRQLDGLLGDQERKRHLVAGIKDKLNARKDFLVKLEQTIADWLMDFYRTIRSQPKQTGLRLMKAFKKAMERIVEMANEVDDTNNRIKALQDELRCLQDKQKLTGQISDKDLRFATDLDIMANRYSLGACQISDRQNCSPVPSRHTQHSCSNFLVGLHGWFTKELQTLQQQMDDAKRQTEQSRQQLAEGDKKRNVEWQNMADGVKALTDKRDTLKVERDYLQAKIDKANFDRCRDAKNVANQLKRVVKETVEDLDIRLPSDKEGVVKLERELAAEDREATEMGRKVEKLQRRIEQQLQELQRLENQLAECGKIFEEQQREFSELEKVYRNRIDSWMCRKNEVSKEVEKAQKRAQNNDALKQKVEVATESCDQLERQICEKGQRARNLRQELENLKMDVVAVECRAAGMSQSIERLKKLSKFRANRIKREKQTLREINDELDREKAKRPSTNQNQSCTPQLKEPMQAAASDRENVVAQSQSGSIGQQWSAEEANKEAIVVRSEEDGAECKKQFVAVSIGAKVNKKERKRQLEQVGQTNNERRKLELRERLKADLKKINAEELELTKQLSDRKSRKSTVEVWVSESRAAPSTGSRLKEPEQK